MYECDTCNREFVSKRAAAQHMDSLNHWAQYECETCDKEFSTQQAANQHMNDTKHWAPQFECETCDRRFHSQNSANQHMNDTKHWAPQFECETCDRSFHSQNSANQHMDATGHWAPQFECETCNREFYSQHSANQHMEALNHFNRPKCHDCNKEFTSENALKMHLNSSTHRGKSVACPFCKESYTTASGLSHHLESGSCPVGNINRETIYKAIRQRDTTGLLTKKLLTYPSSNVQNIATIASWNGYSYECYLCHQEYNTLQALNRHVNSSVHSEKLYHCPNRSCGRDFVRLASLFNHLESESCKFMRFEKVQQNVHNIISGRQKLLGFA